MVNVHKLLKRDLSHIFLLASLFFIIAINSVGCAKHTDIECQNRMRKIYFNIISKWGEAANKEGDAEAKKILQSILARKEIDGIQLKCPLHNCDYVVSMNANLWFRELMNTNNIYSSVAIMCPALHREHEIYLVTTRGELHVYDSLRAKITVVEFPPD